MKKFIAAVLFFSFGIGSTLALQTMKAPDGLFDMAALAQFQSFTLQAHDSPFSVASQLPRSLNLRKDTDFAFPYLNFFQVVTYNNNPYLMPTQIDINGDGLTDLIYSVTNLQQASPTQYILINNGSHYELVYFCAVYSNSGGPIYQGHCADPNTPL